MHSTRTLMSLTAVVALASVGYADQNITTNAMDYGYTITGLPDGSIVEVFTQTGAELLWTKPAGVTALRYLVVGGGGGGGDSTLENCGAGGGGAGGFTEGTLVCESGDAMQVAVTVGIGGAIATSGGASSFSVDGQSVGVNGGGFGGAPKAKQLPPNVTNASAGGGNRINEGKEAKATCDEGIYGNNGGAGPGSTNTAGSGGGGAGGVGEASASKIAGAGGAGKMSDITGEERYYAGGGGGAQNQSYVACGGSGIGGNGAYYVNKAWVQATAGLDGTGSGGGGGFYTAASSGVGGSGVVIIRYTPPSGKEQVELPTLDVDSAVYSGGVQKPTVACDAEKCEIDWGEGNWTDVGSYVVTVSLKGSVEWVDQTTDPKELTFTVTKAGNAWMRLPALGSLVVPSGVGTTIDCGAAAFGAVSATYDEDALKQLELGPHEIAFTVAETANYSGLATNIAFVVRDSSIPVPVNPPDAADVTYTWKADAPGFWYDLRNWTPSVDTAFGYPNDTVYATADFPADATAKGDALMPSLMRNLTLADGTVTLSGGEFQMTGRAWSTVTDGTGTLVIGPNAKLTATTSDKYGAFYHNDKTKQYSMNVVVCGAFEGRKGDYSDKMYLIYNPGDMVLDIDGGTFTTAGTLTYGASIGANPVTFHLRNGGAFSGSDSTDYVNVKNAQVTDSSFAAASGTTCFSGDTVISNATVTCNYAVFKDGKVTVADSTNVAARTYFCGSDSELTISGSQYYNGGEAYFGYNHYKGKSDPLVPSTNCTVKVAAEGVTFSAMTLGAKGVRNACVVVDDVTLTFDGNGGYATVSPDSEACYLEFRGAAPHLAINKVFGTFGAPNDVEVAANGLKFVLPATAYESAVVTKRNGTGWKQLQLYGNATLCLDVTAVQKKTKYPLIDDNSGAFLVGIADAGDEATYLARLTEHLKVVCVVNGVEREIDKSLVTLSIEDGVLYATVKSRNGLMLLIR